MHPDLVRKLQAASSSVDTLLRVPDFTFKKHEPVFGHRQYKIWTALGALDNNHRARKHQMLVQKRLLVIFEAAITAHRQSPATALDSDPFLAETLYHIKKYDDAMAANLTTVSLKLVLHTYDQAYARAHNKADIVANEGNKHQVSVRGQLSSAARRWWMDRKQQVQLKGQLKEPVYPLQGRDETDKLYIRRLQDSLVQMRGEMMIEANEHLAKVAKMQRTMAAMEKVMDQQARKITRLEEETPSPWDHSRCGHGERR